LFAEVSLVFFTALALGSSKTRITKFLLIAALVRLWDFIAGILLLA